MRGAVKIGLVVWAMVAAIAIGFGSRVGTTGGPTEAPTGFELTSNGFAEEFCAHQADLTDSPSSPTIPASDCSFENALDEFTEVDDADEGLGPIFNAASCGECHLTPIIGGSSQVTEKRAGFYNGFAFLEHPGGSLIQDRATEPLIQERAIPQRTNVTALRSSLSILGDGFVEAIGSSTLAGIAAGQPPTMRGQLIQVDVLEQPGQTRTGRFGHKGQQASLVSFAADAYVNEMGITSPLQPTENTSNGVSVADFDMALEHPNNDGVAVELFALFMRSTKAPPVDAARAADPSAQAGSQIFSQIGCAVCHTREILTAAPGTRINGGAMLVSDALGSKRIQPFGDFLLHDIGTGDGIVQNGGPTTRNKIRTVPLWGLRARGRLMHDAMSFSLTDAIQRHAGQAASTRNAFNALSTFDKTRVLAFLMSL